MRLPQTAEYALRAMCELAVLPAGESMRAEDLAERTNVPPHYMAKVLRRLVGAGLLEVRRGPGGGFRLARSPSRVRFADVFVAVDASTLVECAFGFDRCDPRHPCLLHPVWSTLRENVHAWAAKTTLADIQRRARGGARRRR